MSKLSEAKTGHGANPRAVIGDNSAAAAAAEEAQLLSVIAKIKAQRPQTAKAKAALDAERDKELEIFRLAKAAGFSRKELEGYLEDIDKEDAVEIEEAEERRTRRRELLGLPTVKRKKQAEIDFTSEPRDANWWNGEGYRAGLRGAPAKAPEGMPPEFVQPYLDGWHTATGRTAWAQDQVGEDPPSPPAENPESEEAPRERVQDEDEAV